MSYLLYSVALPLANRSIQGLSTSQKKVESVTTKGNNRVPVY